MKNIICTMKKLILVASVLLSVYAIIGVTTSETVYAQDIVVTNGTNINVRSQPSTSSKSLGKLNNGVYLVRYEDRADGWSCIDYCGKQAYIKSTFLTFAMAGTTGAVPATTTSTSQSVLPSSKNTVQNTSGSSSGGSATVWLSATGEKYHSRNNCGKMNPNKAREVTLEYAQSHGYGRCSKCF